MFILRCESADGRTTGAAKRKIRDVSIFSNVDSSFRRGLVTGTHFPPSGDRFKLRRMDNGWITAGTRNIKMRPRDAALSETRGM